MSILKYQAFIQVVESGNLTKAAKQMGYSQPGVSHMIDSLEKEIGFPLLIRNKDNIVPTENGKKILHHCYQIVKSKDDLQSTAAAIQGIMEGTIEVGAYSSLMVDYIPAVVSKFSDAYSNIKFHLRETNNAQIHEMLAKGMLDVGFMVDDVPQGFSFIPLFRDVPYLIMQEDHPLASYVKIAPELLNGCDFVRPISGCDGLLNAVLNKKFFQPNDKYVVSGDQVAIALVAQGKGVGIISSLQKKLLPPNVIAKEFEGEFYRNLGIVVKSLRYASPAVKEFIRVARETAEQWRFT